MNHQLKLSPVAIGVMTTICCGIANSSENEPEVVTVIGTTVTLTQEEIEILPKDNPTLSELLKNQPRVGVDDAQTSMQGGDLAPEEISLAGARPHQTKYTLNGVNINNSTTFGNDNDHVHDITSGHSAGYFIDTNLLESVEVLDHNISAEEGGFTGGVVAAELRKPSDKFVVDYNYRMNDSSWNAKQKVGDNFTDSYATPIDGSGTFQPDFQKRMHALHISGALSDTQRLAINVSKQSSDIPLANNKDVNQRMDNIYLTHLWQFGDWQTTTDFRYAAHKKYRFANDSLQNDAVQELSETKNTHSGLGGTFEVERQFESVRWLNSLSYDQLVDERDADTDYFTTVMRKVNGQFEKYNVGSYGDLTQSQDKWQFKSSAYFEPVTWKNIEHNLKVGVQYVDTRASVDRPKDLVVFQKLELVPNKPTISRLTRYSAAEYEIAAKQYGLFIEDQIYWKNISVNLGVRADEMDTFDQTAISPRFSTSIHTIDSINGVLTLGANRYYSNDVFGSALKAQQKSYQANYKNCTPNDGDWDNLAQDNLTCKTAEFFEPADLTTADIPYANEFSASWQMELGNFDIATTYIYRAQRDGLSYSYDEDTNVSKIHNNIESNNQILSLELASVTPYNIAMGKLSAFWMISYNHREGNGDLSPTYGDGNDPTSGFQDDWVLLDGELVRYSEMDVASYQFPIKSSLDILMNWQNIGLTWNNRINYRQGKKTTSYLKPEEVIIDGVPKKVKSLASTELDDFITWDTALYWSPEYFNQNVNFGLNITNVLNEQQVVSVSGVKAGDTIPNEHYNAGRQIWLNVSLRN